MLEVAPSPLSPPLPPAKTFIKSSGGKLGSEPQSRKIAYFTIMAIVAMSLFALVRLGAAASAAVSAVSSASAASSRAAERSFSNASEPS